MKKIIYAMGMIIFLLTRAVSANYYSTVIDQVNNGFTAAFTAMHLDFIEHPSEGQVRSIGMGYGINIGCRNVFLDRLYTDFSGEYLLGKIRYDGFEPDKKHTPLKTKFTHYFINVDAKVGVVAFDSEYFQIIPYGGLGFRYWTFDSKEDYRYSNFKAIVGAKINWAVTDNLVLSPYVNVGSTFMGRARSEAYEPSENEGEDAKYIGDVKFKLGNRRIKEAGLEINYRLDHEIFFVSNFSYKRFEFGGDFKKQMGGFYEPDSKTKELRFTVGIKLSFL